jgi:hypothetical protein
MGIVRRHKPKGASAAPFLQVYEAPGRATNAPSRKEGDVDTLFHVLGCMYYAVGAVYYMVALVKLARSKNRE